MINIIKKGGAYVRERALPEEEPSSLNSAARELVGVTAEQRGKF
jgi:hypothetical protein